MATKSEHILTSAFETFTRFGVQKTTMGDIAKAAGVARQTLYNAYSNKDALLEAVVRAATEASRVEITSRWERAESFDDVLKTFCIQGALSWHDQIHASPHADEFMEHAIVRNKAAYLESFDQWREDLARQIQRFYPDIATGRLESLSDFIFSSIANCKHDAQDRTMLITRLDLHRTAILALLASA